MDQELAEKVLVPGDMPHGSRGLASVSEAELPHPRVDLGMLHQSLEGLPVRDASAGRQLREDHPESNNLYLCKHVISLIESLFPIVLFLSSPCHIFCLSFLL